MRIATSTASVLLAGIIVTACARATTHTAPSSVRQPIPEHIDFVQYRWVDSTTPRGLAHFTDPQSGEPLVLDDSVWLDISGIDSAWVQPWRIGPDTEFSVTVLHSREASASVGAATATHIGSRAAMLVDGVVVQVATICGALGTKSQLTSFPRRAQADSLAARVDRAARLVRPWRPIHFLRGSVREVAGVAPRSANGQGGEYPPPMPCSHHVTDSPP